MESAAGGGRSSDGAPADAQQALAGAGLHGSRVRRGRAASHTHADRQLDKPGVRAPLNDALLAAGLQCDRALHFVSDRGGHWHAGTAGRAAAGRVLQSRPHQRFPTTAAASSPKERTGRTPFRLVAAERSGGSAAAAHKCAASDADAVEPGRSRAKVVLAQAQRLLAVGRHGPARQCARHLAAGAPHS